MSARCASNGSPAARRSTRRWSFEFSLQPFRQVEVGEGAKATEEDRLPVLGDGRGRKQNDACRVAGHELFPDLPAPGGDVEAEDSRGEFPCIGAKKQRPSVGGKPQRPVAWLEARNLARGSAFQRSEGQPLRRLCHERRAIRREEPGHDSLRGDGARRSSRKVLNEDTRRPPRLVAGEDDALAVGKEGPELPAGMLDLVLRE